MRKQFVKTVKELVDLDDRIVVLLGDIGVAGFLEYIQKYPNRIYNIGILEQSTVGLAAGMSKMELIPIMHTIAPFMVERAFEQLKLDFGYQKLGGNFVSIGASYDYASLGCTHHCPGDVQLLKTIPNMDIVLPGTAKEFDKLFRQTYDNKKPTYFRLTDYSNEESFDVEFEKATVIKDGKKGVFILVGPMLNIVYPLIKDLDVTILYYTTLAPFDYKTLQQHLYNDLIFLCEPYYEGVLLYDIIKNISLKLQIIPIGVPHEFVDYYGKKQEIDNIYFYIDYIKNIINQYIK